jgi:hypothetical protein
MERGIAIIEVAVHNKSEVCACSVVGQVLYGVGPADTWLMTPYRSLTLLSLRYVVLLFQLR